MNANKSKTISKGEWLTHALEVLSEEGVQGIRIDRLARDLQISRSGFYWHFRDRKDLLNHLLDYWAYEFTGVVIHYQELQKLTPENRLYQIANMIRKHNLTKFDLSMRAWAENDANVAKAVARVYQQRLDYVRESFQDLGFEGDELEMRTFLFVCYHSWELTTYPAESERKLNRLQKLRIKLLCQKLSD